MQTYQNLEIMLINDGSPDATEEQVYCEMKKRKDHRIVYYKKDNGGIADAKNFGLAQVSGDYVMFCDHDDWMVQDAVEQLVVALETTGSEIAVGQYVRDFKYRKSILERIFPFQVKLSEFPDKGGKLIDHKGMLVEIYQALWGKLYVREIFQNFQFNIELNGMDDLGSTSILLGKAKRIVGVHNVLYHYAYYKNSTIQSPTSSFQNKKIYDAYNDIESWYIKHDLQKTYEKELEYLYFYHCVLSYGVRTLQRSSHYKQELTAMNKELESRYPNFRQNPYYKKASLGMKLFLPLIKQPLFVEIFHRLLK